MIETERTRRALELATKYHEGQLDKAGEDYINHPIAVAEQMTDETTTIVALLHDVLEDCDISPQELQKEGDLTDTVMVALDCLCRRSGETYMDFIKRLSTNPIAREVKLADLEHNMDLTRLEEITDEDMSRVGRYIKAMKYLK